MNPMSCLVQKLIGALLRKPPDSRYEAITFDQLRRADVEIFKVLSQKCRAGVRPVAGVLPMAQHMQEAVDCHAVEIILSFQLKK